MLFFQKQHQDYKAAPQAVISLSNLGEIKGVTIIDTDTEKPTTTPQPENNAIATKPAATSAPASSAETKPYTTPAFAKAPATPSSSKSPITTVKAPSGPVKKAPTAASIMVDYLSGQKSPDVKIVESSNTEAPKTAGNAAAKKTRGAGGYVNSAILKQPVATDAKASPVPSVYGNLINPSITEC